MWWHGLAELGLAVVGVVRAEAEAPLAALLSERRGQGLYPPFTHPDPAVRADPRRFWPDARTIICVAVPYPAATEPKPPGLYGLIARSLRGQDYHRLVREKLARLAALLEDAGLAPVRWQAWVDGVPPVERALARRAGLGFYGKNCSLIHPALGSWFWLGELALDRELPPSLTPPAPGAEAEACGSCRRCLEACPTKALLAPYKLDPYRCLSYLTQAKGPIPAAYRPLLGHRLFGCDTCQEVCPYNRRPAGRLPARGAERAWLPLEPLVLPGSRRLVAGTALAWRGQSLLARNAAVVLGNSGRPEAVGPLQAALAHPHPLVRGHAAWALGRLATPEAVRALRHALAREKDAAVRSELAAALAGSA